MTRNEALKKAESCLERADGISTSTDSSRARVEALVSSARVYVELAKELRLGT